MKYITILIIALSPHLLFGQCINASATSVCGMETVNFEVNNPIDSITYNWNFGDGSSEQTGSEVSHSFPAGATDETYMVSLISSDSLCQDSIEITVLSAPDASITDLDGNVEFVNCIQVGSGLIYTLTIENNSTTQISNTNYTIDWGDGSPVENIINFTTLTHEYGQGYFELMITVTGDGTLNCNTSNFVYQVFNGSNPDLGIINYGGNFHCSNQESIIIPIGTVATDNNPGETTYTATINGLFYDIYNHPPPDTIFFDFSGYPTSCGLPGDGYEIEVTAQNPCGITLGSTDIYISDPPEITVSLTDTLQTCVGVEYEIESAANIEIYNLGVCEDDPAGYVEWSISPETGWDTLSLSPLTIVFTQDGIYTIEVEAANRCDTISTIGIIEVFPFPDSLNVLVELSSSVLNCVPLQGAFQNLSNDQSGSTENNMSFEWTVDGPADCWEVIDSTAASLDIDFLCAGNYTISLTGINICTELTWDTTIVVTDVPTINLDIPDNLCLPLIVDDYVTYQANGTAITDTLCLVYDIDGVEMGTCEDLSTSLTIGDYIVKVGAVNACGSITAVDTFYIFTEYIEITIDDLNPICEGESINLNTLTEPAGGDWIVNNNTVAMPYTLYETTEFVYLLDSNGCVFSDTLMVEAINTIDVEAGSNLWYCVDAVPPTTLSGMPSGGSWSGNGIEPDGTVNTNSAGIYTFTYTVYDALTDCWPNDTLILTLEEVTAGMNIPEQVCVGDTVLFDNTSVVIPTDMEISTEWNFGDGNISTENSPTHVYTQPGTFIAQFTVSGIACTDVTTQSITVVEQPEAGFTPIYDFCETTVSFQNTSSGGGLSYNWDFGNGMTSDLASPPPIDYAQGQSDTTYTVTLTVSNACGTSVFSEFITIYTQLDAEIYAEASVCTDTELALYGNQSTGYIDNYQWFVDGALISSSATADSINYTSPAVDTITDFEIMLIVSNNCQSDTTYETVTIIPDELIADFAMIPGSTTICEGDSIQFINLSTPGVWQGAFWDFGDGTFVEAGETPVYIFDEPGEYIIRLWAWNICTGDTIMEIINVLPAPNPCFEYTSSCLGTQTCFSLCDTPPEDYVYKWLINEQTYVEHEPCITFPYAGMQEVSLTVTNPVSGCSATYTDSIEIFPVPTADFIWEKDNCNLSINIEAKSEGAMYYIWDFGDEQSGIGATTTHIYPTDGSYIITMTAENEYGCIDSKDQQIQYNPVPVSQFEYELIENCDAPAEVYFTNTSINAISFDWSFGNGQSSFLNNPSAVYIERNTYEVTLIANDQYGCSDTSSVLITPHFCNGIGVPNAFIPEGSEEISLFKPLGEGLKEYRLQIFSPYGELLWQTTELQNGQPAEGWDGRHQGKILPQDVYVWKIHGIFEDGTVWQGMTFDDTQPSKIGSVTLLR